MVTILQKATEEIKSCPRCGKKYTSNPALSRKDNKTLLCPDCGVCEALEAIGVDPEEEEKILETIHRSMEKVKNDLHSFK